MTPAGYRVVRTRWFPRDDYMRSALVTDTVAVFADSDAADADAEAREQAAWLDPGFNPFDYAGPLWYLSSLPDWALRDWVLDHGFVPPQKGRTWHRWYESKRPDPLLMRVALDKLRLFAVEPVGATAWAGGHITFGSYWSEPREAHPEGYVYHNIFRTAAAAELYADRSNGVSRGWDYHAGHAYATTHRDGRTDGRAAADTTFVEATPVDCPAGVPGPGATFLVVRLPFNARGVHDTRGSSHDTDAGVALGLYPTRELADARVRDLFRAAWRTVNPFAFFDVHWFTGEYLDLVREAWPGAPDQSAGDPDRVAAWDAAVPDLGDDARAAVWAELEGRALFEVQEVVLHPGDPWTTP